MTSSGLFFPSVNFTMRDNVFYNSTAQWYFICPPFSNINAITIID